MGNKQITEEMKKMILAPFPKEAVTAHPTKTFLTSIKAQYIIERLNDVFGTGGWNSSSKIVHESEKAVVMEVTLDFGKWDILPITHYGGATIKDKQDLGDIYKSAKTDGVTKCASILGIGMDVFKGLVKPGKAETSATKAQADNDIL